MFYRYLDIAENIKQYYLTKQFSIDLVGYIENV